jgi:ATP-dependent RNA/DNA helicase IGHMBP2
MQRYLEKEEKIMRNELKAERDQFREIYEYYNIETLLKTGHLLYFDKQMCWNQKSNSVEISFFKSDEKELLKKVKPGHDEKVLIIGISDLVFDETYFYIDYDKQQVYLYLDYSTKYFNFRHFDAYIKKENNNNDEYIIEFEDFEQNKKQEFLIMPCPFSVVYKKKINKCLEIKNYLENRENSNNKFNFVLMNHLLGNLFSEPQNFNRRGKAFYDRDLNTNQKNIIYDSLKAEHFYLIHGPPGTGKSTVICEILRQLVIHSNKKVLIAAPPNIAVDNIIIKLKEFENKNLYKKKIKIVRLGNWKKISESVKNMNMYLSQNLKKAWWVSKNFKKKSIIREIEEADVVAITLDSIYINSCFQIFIDNLKKENKKENYFDYMIVDEAAKALNFTTLGTMTYTKKVIMAGDHLQLPPTILDKNNKAEISLFEDIIKKFDSPKLSPYVDHFIGKINIQYRMDNSIMELSSKYFYQFLRSGRDNFENNYPGHCPIIFINTQKSKYTEECMKSKKNEPFKKSFFNKKEAAIAFLKYRELISQLRINENDVGVIAAYSEQVHYIRKIFKKHLKNNRIPEIETVDSFQGREKKIIILSLVRSNKKGLIGFLKDFRRTNVCITRAQKMLVIIGDSKTLKTDPFLDFVIQSIEDKYLEYYADIIDSQRKYPFDKIKKYFV